MAASVEPFDDDPGTDGNHDRHILKSDPGFPPPREKRWSMFGPRLIKTGAISSGKQSLIRLIRPKTCSKLSETPRIK